jgi:predicted aminopeptidase
VRARCQRGSRSLALLAAVLALPGCYYTQLAAGQLELINRQRPLAAALAHETDAERRRLLALVPDIRAFGRDVMQLAPGRSYLSYFATERSGIAYVISASARTRFEPHLFTFPIVGSVAYKSFFDEAAARAAAAELEAEGYDVWVGPATAYSTLGYLRDPVTTVMMRRGLTAFVEVLLHEMTHGRLYVPGQTDFSEQLASFAGERGAEQYLRSRFARDPLRMAELEQHLARRRALEAHVAAALAELQVLYARGLPEARVLALRQPVFARLRAQLAALSPDASADDLVVNNARLLQYQRYLAGGPLMRQLWRNAGGSWVRFWPLVEAYARELD